MTNDDEDDYEETPEDMLAAADALEVLAEMAREGGLERIADLGDLPPLDLATRSKYLQAVRRRREGGDDE
jgi:hypothetical protein